MITATPTAPPVMPVISPFSAESIGLDLIGLGHGNGGYSSTAPGNTWPAYAAGANAAVFYPLRLPDGYPISSLWWINGTTLGGSADVGIYDVNGNRLLSTGATAQAGSGVPQVVAASLTVPPGDYYLAMVNNGVGGFGGTAFVYVVPEAAMCGVYTMAAAFPLPPVATFATATAFNKQIPAFGISTRTLI